MNKPQILRSFMQNIWNCQKAESVNIYVHEQYTTHLDNADPWEGKTLSKPEFIERLRYSFSSFSDINFEIKNNIEDGDNVAGTWFLPEQLLLKLQTFHQPLKKFELWV